MPPMGCKVGRVCCLWTLMPLNCKTRIPLHTDNYVDFNSDMSVDNVLAICGISNKDELCDDQMGCGRTQEEQGVMSLKHGRFLLGFVLLTKPLIHSFTFFYHSTGGHDKENILNMELMLLWLKCKVSIYDCQLQISLRKCYLYAGINTTFITSVDLSTKCKIFILCFLMFLTYLIVSHNFHFPTFTFYCPVPSQTMHEV